MQDKIKIFLLTSFTRKNRLFDMLVFGYFNIYYFLYFLYYIRRKKIILGLTPPFYFSNLGDHIQTLAIRQWISTNYADHKYIELDKDQGLRILQLLRLFIKSDDILILQGGGNMGDNALWTETRRRTMVRYFPKNKVLIMPVSLHFSESTEGINQRHLSSLTYSQHPDLTLLVRDKQSFDFCLSEQFCKQVFLTPDIALYFSYDSYKLKSDNKNKILLCLRKDEEIAVNQESIINLLNKEKIDYVLTDTFQQKFIFDFEREKIAREYMEFFSSFRLVITDRLHGLIIAVLTKSKCIVLNNKNNKVFNSKIWFKDLSFIHYCDSESELNKLIQIVDNKEYQEIELDWKKFFILPKLN